MLLCAPVCDLGYNWSKVIGTGTGTRFLLGPTSGGSESEFHSLCLSVCLWFPHLDLLLQMPPSYESFTTHLTIIDLLLQMPPSYESFTTYLTIIDLLLQLLSNVECLTTHLTFPQQ